MERLSSRGHFKFAYMSDISKEWGIKNVDVVIGETKMQAASDPRTRPQMDAKPSKSGGMENNSPFNFQAKFPESDCVIEMDCHGFNGPPAPAWPRLTCATLRRPAARVARQRAGRHARWRTGCG